LGGREREVHGGNGEASVRLSEEASLPDYVLVMGDMCNETLLLIRKYTHDDLPQGFLGFFLGSSFPPVSWFPVLLVFTTLLREPCFIFYFYFLATLLHLRREWCFSLCTFLIEALNAFYVICAPYHGWVDALVHKERVDVLDTASTLHCGRRDGVYDTVSSSHVWREFGAR
jgi:hypothetical protein